MNTGLKNIVTILSITLAFFIVWQLKTIVGYVLISLVLVLIGRPIMQLLQKLNIKDKSCPIASQASITLAILFCFLLECLAYLPH